MQVIYDISKIKQFKKAVLAIGVFDGLHLGHQLVIKKTVEEAKKINGKTIVLTFFPHPNHVLKPAKYLPFLVSLKHRLKLIEKLGVDVCILVNFTENFSNLSARNFVERFLVKKIKPRKIFVGADFTFGKDKNGNVDLLRKLGDFYGFKTKEIPRLKISGEVISSTLIRGLIKDGNLNKASLFLGRPVSILGKVMKGKGIGRVLGFPTANITNSHEVMPSTGVYAVRVAFNKRKFLGMAYIAGPRLYKNLKPFLEVHVFNFKKNLYGKEIEVEFYKKIRKEKRFKHQNALRKEIGNDAKKVKKFFSPHPNLKTAP
ncbi:MAG: bifunctional riboflavin kinase/FAD synthetase [Candidatus Omnitrophota bacterium]|nr:bifunctional riboflavin kinase/FAD synthetase [Candidatus Omnitrophota bacterium]